MNNQPLDDNNPMLTGALTAEFAHYQAWAFRDTVEGREGRSSVDLVGKELQIQFGQQIEKKAKPRPELIAELLRSDTPLTPQLRWVIAQWLDAEGESLFLFKGFKRRAGHRPKRDFDRDKAEWIEKAIRDAGNYECGIAAGMAFFGISRTTAADHVQKNRALLAAEQNPVSLAVRKTSSI
jgi:hypothetical protein